MPLWVPYVRIQGQLLRPVAITKSLLGGLYRAYWRDGSCSAIYPNEVVWKHEQIDLDSPEG